MAVRASHDAPGVLRPICETCTPDGEPFFASGTVFADPEHVDANPWLEERGGFHAAGQGMISNQ